MAQPTLSAIAKADLISMHRHGVYGWGHEKYYIFCFQPYAIPLR